MSSKSWPSRCYINKILAIFMCAEIIIFVKYMSLHRSDIFHIYLTVYLIKTVWCIPNLPMVIYLVSSNCIEHFAFMFYLNTLVNLL